MNTTPFLRPVPVLASVLWGLALSLALWPLPAARASNPTVTKLHSRTQTPALNDFFGWSVAVSDAWLLVGEHGSDDLGNNAGAAFLYDARTGRFRARLTPDDASAVDAFGASVALCGNLAVVGAPFEDGGGAVYGFDARSGKPLWKLESNQAGEGFGIAIALSGRRLLVGAMLATDNGQAGGGLAYLYDLSGQAPLLAQTLSREGNAAAGARFGGAVALCGRLALVGCDQGNTSPQGFAYLFDADTGQRQQAWTDANIWFGTSVALDAGRAVVGTGNVSVRVYDPVTGLEAPLSPIPSPHLYPKHGALAVNGNLLLIGEAWANSFTGQARLFDLAGGRELRQFLAPDSAMGDLFGFSVALCGNRAVVGALNDDDLAPDGGSAYYLREIAGPMPLMTLAKTRDFAPGVPGADFRALIDPVLNPNGETAFCATLTGSGAGRGAAAKGVWSDFGAPWSLGLVARGGGNTDLGGGVMVKTVGKPVFNRTDDLVFPGSKQGSGVTSGNDTALFRANGSTGMVNAFLSEGQTFPAFVGAELDRFFEVAQSHSGAIADAAVAFQYKKGPGGVDKFSDSGVLAIDHDGSLRDVFQEDFELDSAAQVFWAQFSPRVSITGSQMAWSAFLTGDTVTAANNQGVFRIQPGAVAETPVARKGDMLPGGKISSLLAEAIAPDNAVVYRAALTEAPKTENELLSFEGATVWNKGDLVSNFESSVPFGVRIVRLLKFWPIAGAKVIYLAKMSGPGVNKSNDCGLFLWDNAGIGDEKSQLLLREGDDARGCDCPRVGSIQRVDVEPATGKYLVLASLTGNKAANQALFAGDACGGSVTTYRALRLPVLKLRKGTAHQAALGQTTKILSLSFTETADKAGAGAKGLGQVIGLDGDVSVCVQFTNKAKELMSGKP